MPGDVGPAEVSSPDHPARADPDGGGNGFNVLGAGERRSGENSHPVLHCTVLDSDLCLANHLRKNSGTELDPRRYVLCRHCPVAGALVTEKHALQWNPRGHRGNVLGDRRHHHQSDAEKAGFRSRIGDSMAINLRIRPPCDGRTPRTAVARAVDTVPDHGPVLQHRPRLRLCLSALDLYHKKASGRGGRDGNPRNPRDRDYGFSHRTRRASGHLGDPGHDAHPGCDLHPDSPQVPGKQEKCVVLKNRFGTRHGKGILNETGQKRHQRLATDSDGCAILKILNTTFFIEIFLK